jgi:hypothetical protein
MVDDQRNSKTLLKGVLRNSARRRNKRGTKAAVQNSASGDTRVIELWLKLKICECLLVGYPGEF